MTYLNNLNTRRLYLEAKAKRLYKQNPFDLEDIKEKYYTLEQIAEELEQISIENDQARMS